MASTPHGVVLGDDPGPHALASDTSSASYAGLGGTTTDATVAVNDAAPNTATTTTTRATDAARYLHSAIIERGVQNRGLDTAVTVADRRDSLLTPTSPPSASPFELPTLPFRQMDFTTPPPDTLDGGSSAATASVSPRLVDVDHPPYTESTTTTSVPSLYRQQVGHKIRRKPLSSSSASSLAAARSSDTSTISPLQAIDLPKPDHRFDRSHSIDSPTLYEYPSSVRDSLPLESSTPVQLPSADDKTAEASRHIPADEDPVNQQAELSDVLSEYDDLISNGSRNSIHDQTPTTIFEVDDIGPRDPDNSVAFELDISPMPAPKPTPPHLKLEKVDTTVGDVEAISASSVETPQQLNKPLPKSPGATSPFAALFGWGNPSPSGTEFSSIPSPSSPPKREGSLHAFSTPVQSEPLSGSFRSNAGSGNPINYCESYLSTPPPTISPSVIQIAEMEDELKAISSELAASIRREMDLEDLVDRLQEQINTNQTPGRRTSDYFSDSGYSSAKASEYEQSRDEIEKISRKAEQEKASLRLELTNKVQDERAKRKALDQQIKELVEKTSQIDLVAMNSLDANGRLKELESTCEDLRRKLAEERESKTNFEEILSALKIELQGTSNERDNLRDEVVPQLRARVEGLESEAAEYANLTYESSKMQQELQTLKQENTNLRRASRPVEDVPTRASRAFSGGLSRSNSVATGMARGPRAGGISLSRSNSVKGGQVESREALAERLKDVEAQRDALHNALKNLLERQEYQNRENLKKIRVLEGERERLLMSSPKKAGFEKEVSNLRTEINVLRRRAEDALEQKWQVEKGLVGLKMDLDRAEEEIASLRALLAEKDILIPPAIGRSSNSSNSSGALSVPVTSESLRVAYQDLQASYSEALDRIKTLEHKADSEAASEKTHLAIERLERSLASAVTERDAARKEADTLLNKYNGLAAGEAKNVESERVLADELSESAHQIEQLAAQVQQQLAANAELRSRLSEAVARGDDDRKANYTRIAELQQHLSSLEEQLVAAQSASEDRVARHEEEIIRLKEAHNEQLRRMDVNPGFGGMRSPGLKSPRMLSNRNSPLFTRSSSIMQAKTFEEEAQIKTLKANVVQLEKALADAETEMQEVVAKMSTAQIEVLTLQEEREAAVRETRRLQKILEAEQVKSFEDRFKTLSGIA